MVCIPPPTDPPYPIIMDFWVNPWIVTTNHHAEVSWFGDNGNRAKGEAVVSVWDPGTGAWAKIPPTLNRIPDYGDWQAPNYPGKTRITVKCTWQDGTVAFADHDVYVVDPFP